ncbi:MAG: SDR family NAD(P)-dependent oxidoreductase [Kiritimatiellae bacterium]|nr:SDR family NAD(P)-dependent oxidoreductase [Kiritimatiellia bacterium]
MKEAEQRLAAGTRLARTALTLRGLLAVPSGDEDNPHRRVLLRALADAATLDFLDGPEAEDPARCPVPAGEGSGPPLFVGGVDFDRADDEPAATLRSAIERRVADTGALPGVVLVRGAGIFALRKSDETEAGPLRNTVAVVTGAAGAIGAGICRGLLEQGACVAATDLPGERLDAFVQELQKTAAGRVIGVPLDVTDRQSVSAAFDAVTGAWGGIDIVVVNAGIAHVSSLADLDLDDFRKLEKVNIEGALLTIAEGAVRLQQQATGGDIVVVSTKNVFAPGAGFGAYSATKAACHQLARIASLELATHGIRVNMVAPDAVFSDGVARKSGLWETVGPDRMRARGLDEKGLQEYYRSRNLLKARVTPRHVANAVLFFVTHQTPTTGATIPVDGGLPDATPR